MSQHARVCITSTFLPFPNHASAGAAGEEQPDPRLCAGHPHHHLCLLPAAPPAAWLRPVAPHRTPTRGDSACRCASGSGSGGRCCQLGKLAGSTLVLLPLPTHARLYLIAHFSQLLDLLNDPHAPPSLATAGAAAAKFAPPQADPPADPELRQAIDSLAFFVAKNGELWGKG